MSARGWGVALLAAGAVAIVFGAARQGGVGAVPGAVLIGDGVLLLLCGLAALSKK